MTNAGKEPEARCPVCGQSDRVLRVSALYVAGLEQKYHKKTQTRPAQQTEVAVEGTEGPQDFSSWEEFPPGSLAALSTRISPPASKKQLPSRPLHPDLVLAAFCLISPVFLYGIVTTQPAMMAIAAPLLAGFLVFYFWQRKKLVARYQEMITSQRNADERVRRAIERWLWLRCCARDQVVFLPGREAVPLEHMNELLFAEASGGGKDVIGEASGRG